MGPLAVRPVNVAPSICGLQNTPTTTGHIIKFSMGIYGHPFFCSTLHDITYSNRDLLIKSAHHIHAPKAQPLLLLALLDPFLTSLIKTIKTIL